MPWLRLWARRIMSAVYSWMEATSLSTGWVCVRTTDRKIAGMCVQSCSASGKHLGQRLQFIYPLCSSHIFSPLSSCRNMQIVYNVMWLFACVHRMWPRYVWCTLCRRLWCGLCGWQMSPCRWPVWLSTVVGWRRHLWHWSDRWAKGHVSRTGARHQRFSNEMT